jgi:hypothetical protein
MTSTVASKLLAVATALASELRGKLGLSAIIPTARLPSVRVASARRNVLSTPPE